MLIALALLLCIVVRATKLEFRIELVLIKAVKRLCQSLQMIVGTDS
jgi:hypothetical protein